MTRLPSTTDPGEAAIPTCREMAELVTDYLEGAMSRTSRASIRWHLIQCKACTRYYDQMRRTVAMLANAPRTQAASDDVADNVLARLRRDARLQPGDD